MMDILVIYFHYDMPAVGEGIYQSSILSGKLSHVIEDVAPSAGA
jgi:hypothetical protein